MPQVACSRITIFYVAQPLALSYMFIAVSNQGVFFRSCDWGILLPSSVCDRQGEEEGGRIKRTKTQVSREAQTKIGKWETNKLKFFFFFENIVKLYLKGTSFRCGVKGRCWILQRHEPRKAGKSWEKIYRTDIDRPMTTE